MPTARSHKHNVRSESPSGSACEVAIFPSKLGWMGLVTSNGLLKQVSSGYDSLQDVAAAIQADTLRGADPGRELKRLVKRLQHYAEGRREDFADVAIDLDGATAFRRNVIERCRQIPFGAVRSYAELATLAGSPGAARAVGNIMATNRFPLIVPCHRVLASQGRIGGYSGPHGVEMKRRLLAHEQQASERQPARR